MRTGSVSGIPPQQALLLLLNPSWFAGSMDAAVAVKGLAGGPSCCGRYGKEQIAAYELAGESLAVNPSEREIPGFVEPAAQVVHCTSRYCHLQLKISSAHCEGGCLSGNGDGYAENVGSAVCVECAESAERFGSAESVRTYVRCDGNVGSVGAVCRGPLFHNWPQTPRSHAAVDGSEKYWNGKKSH